MKIAKSEYSQELMTERMDVLQSLRESATEGVLSGLVTIDPEGTVQFEQAVGKVDGQTIKLGTYVCAILDATAIPLDGQLSHYAFAHGGTTKGMIRGSRLFGDSILHKRLNLSSRNSLASYGDSGAPVWAFYSDDDGNSIGISRAYAHIESNFHQNDLYSEHNDEIQDVIELEPMLRSNTNEHLGRYDPILPFMTSARDKPFITAPLRRWSDFFNQHLLSSMFDQDTLLVSSSALSQAEEMLHDTSSDINPQILSAILYSNPRDEDQHIIRQMTEMLESDNPESYFTHAIKNPDAKRFKFLDMILEKEGLAWDIVRKLIADNKIIYWDDSVSIDSIPTRKVKVNSSDTNSIKTASEELLVAAVQSLDTTDHRKSVISARKEMNRVRDANQNRALFGGHIDGKFYPEIAGIMNLAKKRKHRGLRSKNSKRKHR